MSFLDHSPECILPSQLRKSFVILIMIFLYIYHARVTIPECIFRDLCVSLRAVNKEYSPCHTRQFTGNQVAGNFFSGNVEATFVAATLMSHAAILKQRLRNQNCLQLLSGQSKRCTRIFWKTQSLTVFKLCKFVEVSQKRYPNPNNSKLWLWYRFSWSISARVFYILPLNNCFFNLIYVNLN